LNTSLNLLEILGSGLRFPLEHSALDLEEVMLGVQSVKQCGQLAECLLGTACRSAKVIDVFDLFND